MQTVYFWVAIYATLAALGWWKTVAALFVCKVLNYYFFEYEAKVPKSDFKVAIVGAGFSGIGMAVKLKKMGVEYELFEAAEEVGGTWWSNTYPGCACDIQSHLYSYSFYPNAFWTRKYPKQPEILEYLKDVVRAYDIKVNNNSKVECVKFDDVTRKYTVKLHGGREVVANAVVYGAGALREPVKPDFPGMDRFQGDSIHSAEWHANFDVTNKRVAVIGTGASSVQIVPTICDQVDQLFVFQRTPCWSPPRNDAPVPEWLKFLYNYVPGVLYLRRLSLFLIHEGTYFVVFRTNTFKWIINHIRGQLVAHHMKTVKDPKTAEKLTPDFAPGCKRITPSDDYLPSFNKKNVHLVTDSISEITEKGIETSGGIEYPLDMIIYATGYSPLESLRKSFEVYDGKGNRLNDVITDHPKAHLGITFPNFPNLFALLGPQTGLGHNSVVWMIECEINYIASCVRHMIENDIKSISVRQSRLDAFMKFVDEYMVHKVFFKGCFSWYRNKDGSGANYALWPSNLFHYWWLTRKPDMSDFKSS